MLNCLLADGISLLCEGMVGQAMVGGQGPSHVGLQGKPGANPLNSEVCSTWSRMAWEE